MYSRFTLFFSSCPSYGTKVSNLIPDFYGGILNRSWNSQWLILPCSPSCFKYLKNTGIFHLLSHIVLTCYCSNFFVHSIVCILNFPLLFPMDLPVFAIFCMCAQWYHLISGYIALGMHCASTTKLSLDSWNIR